MADLAADDLDQFESACNRLAYAGHVDLVAEMLARALPLLLVSDKYFEHVKYEFTFKAQQFALLAYLERTALPRADDPILLAALERFAPIDRPEILAEQIALITGQEDRPWDRSGDEKRTRISRLGFRFQGELVRRWGLSFARAELGRVALVTYVDERRTPTSAIAQAVKQAPKGRSKPAASKTSVLLCPDRESLDRYVARHLNFISFRLIEAAVTLEVVPAWILFLHDQGLITAERRAQALREISPLVGQAAPIWAQNPSNPTLGPNIEAAWARAMAE